MVGPRSSARHGFSIVEVAVSTIILTSLTGAILMASTRAASTYAQSTATGDLNARAARAIQRVSHELLGARWSNVTPKPLLPFDTDNLEFELPVDTANGAITWGARRQIALQLVSGELDNGLDDNGNGIMDEQSIVLVENPGLPNERRIVLVNGIAELLEGEIANVADDNGNGLIDEGGLSFSIDDDRLIIRMSLQRSAPSGQVLTRTQQLDLVLRNRG